MAKQKRRRVIKKGEGANQPDTHAETEVEEAEPVGIELPAAVSYKLNESTILMHDVLATPNGGYSERKLSAFVDALAGFIVSNKHPEEFVEARASIFAKEGESTEEEVEE